MLPSPLVHTAGLPGKAAAMGCCTQRAGQASRRQGIRIKALLPGGNTRPEGGRRSPMCVHDSKCPGGGSGLGAAVPVPCRHLLSHSACTQQLCLSWLCVSSSGCGSAHLPHCSKAMPQAGGAAPELLHSQPVSQCCVWAPSRNSKPLS